jgi:Fe-S oxidoreductase
MTPCSGFWPGENIEAFAKYGVKKIICTSPHDYNVLRKEYGLLAASLRDSEGRPVKYEVEVYHHTEIIANLLKEGRISLTGRLNSVITYHDPCFLGRYNDVYDEPRDIISAIPEATLAEMNHYGPGSFCCGGGGTGMFMKEKTGGSTKGFPARYAQYTGASIISTACPYCQSRLSDGLAELNIKNTGVLDIAQLVFSVMKRDS